MQEYGKYYKQFIDHDEVDIVSYHLLTIQKVFDVFYLFLCCLMIATLVFLYELNSFFMIDSVKRAQRNSNQRETKQ